MTLVIKAECRTDFHSDCVTEGASSVSGALIMSVSQRFNPRKKMVVILLLFFTLTCVCGQPQVPLYQAEEDHNTTLRWDGPNKMDLSFINIDCLSTSTPAKYLFEMIGGVETSQDEQFSGRVHCDREALKEGRVRIHLFRLKPEDSGNYLCHMSIYDPVKRESQFLCTDSRSTDQTLKQLTEPKIFCVSNRAFPVEGEVKGQRFHDNNKP